MLGSKPLSINELQILDMCFMHESVRVAFKLCLYTGLRPQEMLHLNVGDVVGQTRLTLLKRSTKGRIKSRNLILHPDLISVLSHHCKGRAETEPLFVGPKGNRLSYNTCWRYFKVAVERANLRGKVGLHSGRKTFARAIYQNSGKDIAMTAKLLGHTDVRNVMSYLSFETETLDRVVTAVPWAHTK